MHGQKRETVTILAISDFRAPWTARRAAHALRRGRVAPSPHPPAGEWCVPISLGRSRALRDHRAQVHGKLRTLSRCRVSRSNSRVAHRSCSQRAALVAATPSAASAAMNSSFSCVSNICVAAEDVVTHRWVTDRHETSTAQVKRRWTHLGQPICDSCSKGLNWQAPPPHAHGHSRRHTHPSAGALRVC